MKLLKKIVTTIISIFLILLVTFNIYNFVSINLLHKDMAKVAGYALLEVVSGSMEPTIMVGDLIIIDTNCKEYKDNDIITFRDINDAFVTHRIISIDHDKNTMITQGDANDSKDEAMSTNAIVGKYVVKIPAMGKVMGALKNPLVMVLILVIGIIVCALVSTDDNLNPKDLKVEDEEFLEFKRQKELAKMQEEQPEVKLVKKPTKTKETAKKGETKAPVKKTSTKKKVEDKVEEEKVEKTVKTVKKTSSPTKKTSTPKKTTSTEKKSSASSAKKTSTSKKTTSTEKKNSTSKKTK